MSRPSSLARPALAARNVALMNEEEMRKVARRRLKAKSDFWGFIGIFAIVTVLLSAIWFVTSPGGYYWPVWAILGMGIAAMFIGLDAYGPGRRYYTDQDIDAEIDRMTGRAKGTSGRMNGQ